MLDHRCRWIPSLALLVAASIAASAVPATALEPVELQQLQLAEQQVREVGAAIVSWATDQVSLTGGQPPRLLGSTVDVTVVPVISRAALEAVLVPDYTDSIPDLDPWGTPYEYRFDPAWTGTGSVGGARSAGADGAFDGTVYTVGDNVAPAEDLLRWDGVLVRRLGPPFLPEIERAARTAQDIVVVTIGAFEWLVDQSARTAPPQPLGTVDLSTYDPIAAADLRALLELYGTRVPDTDGWGHSFEYFFDPDPPFDPPLFAVRSRGRDGVAEGNVYTTGTYPAIEFNRDIVNAEFQFIQIQDSFDELIHVDGFESGDARFWSALSP